MASISVLRSPDALTSTIHGPFQHNNVLYFVGLDTTTSASALGIAQSVDNGDTWTVAASYELTSSVGAAIESIDAFQDGNILTIAVAGSGDACVVIKWDIDAGNIVFTSPVLFAYPDVSGLRSIYLGRSGTGAGDFVIARQVGTTKVMGTDYQRMEVSLWNGSWTTAVPSNHGTTTVNHYVRGVSQGYSDATVSIFYIFYTQSSASELRVLALATRSNGSHSILFDAVAGTLVGGTRLYPVGRGAFTGQEVIIPYEDGSGQIATIHFASSDSTAIPTFTYEPMNPPVAPHARSSPGAIVVDDNSIAYMFYIPSAGGLHSTNNGGARTWEPGTPIGAGIPNGSASPNVIDNGASIGYIYAYSPVSTVIGRSTRYERIDSAADVALVEEAPVLSFVAASHHGVALRWPPVEYATEYVVSRDGVDIGTTAKSEFHDTTVSTGQSPVYSVRGTNIFSEGPESNTVTVPIPSAEPSSQLITFSGEAIGSKPSGWLSVWDESSLIAVVSPERSTDARALRLAGELHSREAFTYYRLGRSTDCDIRIRARVKYGLTANEEGLVRIMGRVDASGNGIALQLSQLSGSGRISLISIANFAQTEISSTSFSFSAGEWFQLRLRLSGNQATARAWNDSSQEPNSWSLSSAVPILTEGLIGLGRASDTKVCDIDAFSYATGSGTPAALPSVSPVRDYTLSVSNLSAIQTGATVTLNWSHSSYANRFVIIRGGVPVGVSNESSYQDSPPPGNHTYEVVAERYREWGL